MEYQFQAKGANGEIICGRKEAVSEHDVALWLKELSLAPINIRRRKYAELKEKLRSTPGDRPFSRIRIRPGERAQLFRNLAFLCASNISLAASVSILGEQAGNSRMGRILSEISQKIDSGTSFSQTLRNYPLIFDPLCVAFVRCGEDSGQLTRSLAELASLLEGRERLRKKMISAMTYPATVLIIAFAVLVIMAVVVMPQFEKAFSALDVAMPPVTEFILGAGKRVSETPILCLAPLILCFIAVIVCRSAAVRSQLDAVILRLPFAGQTLSFAAFSRSFGAIASLLDSGVPLSTALVLAGEVASNARIRLAFERLNTGALAGIPLNAAMQECSVFPPSAALMIRVGEETGRTGAMFKALAAHYENELGERIKRLASLLEPILVVFVGAIVALLITALYMPIVSTIESFI